MVDVNPIDYQMEYLINKSKWIAVNPGRQTGKLLFTICDLIRMMKSSKK
ncbi:MAG: hypothetical protein ACYCPW_03295 [Nitrososphaerales archaeon]